MQATPKRTFVSLSFEFWKNIFSSWLFLTLCAKLSNLECQKSPIWPSGVIVLNKIYFEHINLCLPRIFFGTTPAADDCSGRKGPSEYPKTPTYQRMISLESGHCCRFPYQSRSFFRELFFIFNWLMTVL